MMNLRLARPERLIDINRLPQLDHIRTEGAELVIGALARHADVKASALVATACPLMHKAYEWVAHGAVRNRGTLCGNLCHADPASEMPAVALAIGAHMVLRSAAGTRTVAAADFFTGLYSTATRADEMLVELRIPVAPAGQTSGFAEVSMRKGDFAWALAAVLLQTSGGLVTHAAVAVAGVGDRACRLPSVEAALSGQPATAATFAHAADLARAAVNPYGDAANSAEYRKDLVRALVERALLNAA
jgi:aerobic carbon-monoxide dehydrogenase medium subunit